MSLDISNYNVLTLNNPNNINTSDINTSNSDITINNSLKVQKSTVQDINKSLNLNAGIKLKDINSNGSGEFYRIHVNSEPTNSPTLFFNNNEVIDTSNLLNELENILQFQTLDTSNIIITGGYLNFANGSNPNTNQGETGVGIRYSANNTVQFKNYDSGWIDLVDILQHDEFKDLKDVDVYTNPLINKQYITYNSSNAKFVNTQLAIINDPNPTLGGDLNMGDYLVRFSDTMNRIVYNGQSIIDNNLLTLTNNTTFTSICNYIDISNADITGDVNPSITAKSTYDDSNVGININTFNSGDINLNAMQGQVNINSQNINVSGSISMTGTVTLGSINITGYTQSSIYRTSTIPGGYEPNVYWQAPLDKDTLLFNFNNSSTDGSYFANVGVGVDGQRLNLVFNNSSNISSNINVKIFFGANKLLVGSGFADGLSFDTNGQSSSLLYLGEDINAWQALNTGAILF